MDNPPDVLLFVFDTLRPDYLSCYGVPSAVETPNIDKVAAEGTLFKQAFSVGPNTEISHGGLFTGQYPSETGLVGGPHKLPENVTTMASYFSELGYATYGISGPSKIRSDLGFNRGFDTYVEPYYEELNPEISFNYLYRACRDNLVRRDFIRTLFDGPDSLTSLKFDLLQKRLSGESRPFFGFVNLLTTHTIQSATIVQK
jgi:arylsulfatase A-like enzyme